MAKKKASSAAVAEPNTKAVHVEDIGFVLMRLAERADAEGREELLGVERAAQQALHPAAAHDRQQVTVAGAGLGPARDQPGQLGSVLEEPVEAPGKARQSRQRLRLDGLDREERDQPDE